MQLSPLNFAGLIATQFVTDPEAAALAPKGVKRRKGYKPPRCVWECAHCLSGWDTEDQAAECCNDEVGHTEENHACPVCAAPTESPRDAADCCLWKDLDAPTRWRLADRVEAGESWAEVLGVNTQTLGRS